MKFIFSFCKNEKGATAIEYGLIAFLVGIAGIVAFSALGAGILDTYTGIDNDFCNATSDDC